jgi:hypothetical protein
MILLIFAQFTLADSLYNHHHYDLAYIEYERTFFFYPELQATPQKWVQYAISLFHSDQYRGIREFHDILQNRPDLASELKIDIARCYLDSGYAHEASGLFIQTDEKKLLGYTFLFDNRLYSARDVFSLSEDSVIVQEINTYFEMPKKSPRTAALLSLICPGAGEIYGGNTKLGIQDFLLNLGSGFLLYNAMRKKKYVDAVLIFSLFFNRFYIGSIHNAQESAQKTNEKSREIWFNHIKTMYFTDLD